jgi:hypothetical protein
MGAELAARFWYFEDGGRNIHRTEFRTFNPSLKNVDWSVSPKGISKMWLREPERAAMRMKFDTIATDPPMIMPIPLPFYQLVDHVRIFES